MLHKFKDEQKYLCGIDARVHSLGVSWNCEDDCDETDINNACKVQG